MGPRSHPQREQNAATRYTARWHRVRAWALSILPGDIMDPEVAHRARISLLRGQWVNDLFDDEEALPVALELARLELAPAELGPDGEEGGRRRVLVRLFTWVLDQRANVLYDGQWITTGEGMNARAASAAHNRWIRAYALAVSRGLESRRLRATAMEVAWWTASDRVLYV